MEFRNRSIRPWMEGYHGMMELQDEHKNPWVKEFPDVWARYDLDCGLVAEEEDVTWDHRVPCQKEKSLLPDLDRQIALLLQQMLEEGIVVQGRSPYNSRPHLFSKKNGEMRLTLNFKAIHKVIPRQPTESLYKTEVVRVLSPHSRYFSTLDLSCSSFAIPLTAASRLRFAFTFRRQKYLFARLPPCFYLTNSIVHRRVARMLAQLPPEDKGWVSSYVDDMIIAGRTREETASRTRRVLRLIQDTGFKVKLRKAQLVQPEVDYLGMKLSARGRELQASKREYITKVPSPSDPSSLCSLLKMLYCYQDHVEDYAKLELPLQQLVKEEWQWGQKQQQALRRLKQAILTAPALRFVDRSQPFIIRPTVSNQTTGAALLQENEKGEMVPVWFKSKVLKKHQVFYLPKEKHCVAVVRAVDAFQDLIGPAPIVIQMPCSPWKYLLWGDTKTFCWPTPCKKQWNLLLVNGGINIPTAPQRPSGASVRLARPLQQVPSSVPRRDIWFTAGSWACTAALGFAATNLEERWLLGLMQHGSPADVELEAIRVLLQEHRSSKPLYIYANAQSVVQGLCDGDSKDRSNEQLWQSVLQWVHANPGVLHVGYGGDGKQLEWNRKVVERAQSIQMWVLSARGQRVWEPSKHERQEIVALSHIGHAEVRKMLNRVWQVARWEGDHEQVAQWVQRCSCTSSPPQPQRTEGPWSRLQLAHVKGLPRSSEGYSSLLVLLDKFSRWVDAFPIQKGKMEEVVELLRAHVAHRLGMPCCVSVGHREHFLQDAVRMGLQMDVDVQYPPPNWVTAITTSLQRLAQSAGKHWADNLSLILASLRATYVHSEVLGPYQLCFHHPLILRLSPIEGEAAPGPTKPLLPWLARLREDRAEYKQKVEEAMESVDCDAE